MISFPNCKINLGLRIIGKRPDGYHDLESVFLPLPVCDALELIQDPLMSPGNITFSSTGLELPGTASENLCVTAYRKLCHDFPELPAVRMHLHKVIPSGAGLGGGSADAASTFILLNEKFGLGLSSGQLHDYAAATGSDCPFFIVNQPCLVTGRGEIIERLHFSLAGHWLVLIHPGIHVSTSAAFAGIKPTKQEKRISQIISQPIATWKKELKNDFEENIFLLHPAISNIKDKLYALGADYASMSGSGSSVYGIFSSDLVEDDRLRIKKEFPEYSIFFIANPA